MESLNSDSPTGDGKISNLFLQCTCKQLRKEYRIENPGKYFNKQEIVQTKEIKGLSVVLRLYLCITDFSMSPYTFFLPEAEFMSVHFHWCFLA
jgi:hypothetical protein